MDRDPKNPTAIVPHSAATTGSKRADFPASRWRLAYCFAGWLGAIACLLEAQQAAAQSFGTRNLGAETIGRRTRPGNESNEAGGLLGNPNLDPGATMSQGLMNPGARFIRRNRDAADFVGRDFSETRNFIGAESGGLTMSALRSAVNELRQAPEVDANQQTPAPTAGRKSIYPPRLRLDWSVNTPAGTPPAAAADRRLAEALTDQTRLPIGVSLVGRKAILRGEVASEHQRRLAAALARLEPGIDAVQNDLVVSEERDSGPPRPAESEPPSAELVPPRLGESLPSTSESLAPRSSPAVKAPVVRPVEP